MGTLSQKISTQW